jgi:hypothetical protein
MPRRTSNAKVAQTVHPSKLVHHRTLLRIAVLLPQLPQPDQLEDLLWKEEGADEVWVWAKRCKIPVVDVHHIGRRENAILLQSKVVDERCRRKVAHRGLCVTHADGCDGTRSGGAGVGKVTCTNAMRRDGIVDAE